MLPRNLLVPLIGLCLYSQANNINLCNNTAMMIIILALIIEQKEIEDLNGNYDTASTRTSGNNTNSGDTYTYNYGNQRNGYYDNGCYNNGYYNNGCCCNTANNRSYNGYYPYPYYYPYGRSGNGCGCCNNCGCNTVVY